MSTINKPISYRQYSKPVDLENTIKIYQDVYQNVLAEYMAVRDELKDIASHLKETMKSVSESLKDKLKHINFDCFTLRMRYVL